MINQKTRKLDNDVEGLRIKIQACRQEVDRARVELEALDRHEETVQLDFQTNRERKIDSRPVETYGRNRGGRSKK